MANARRVIVRREIVRKEIVHREIVRKEIVHRETAHAVIARRETSHVANGPREIARPAKDNRAEKCVRAKADQALQADKDSAPSVQSSKRLMQTRMAPSTPTNSPRHPSRSRSSTKMATGKSPKRNSARCVRKAAAFPVVVRADPEPDQKVVVRDVRKVGQTQDRRVAPKALPVAVAAKVVHPASLAVNNARSVRNLRNSQS